MHVHPALAALRTDPVRQRRALAAMDGAVAAWRDHGRLAKVEASLSRFSAGDSLARLPDLAVLISDTDAACALIDAFLNAFIPALRKEPLGEVPLRHSSSAGYCRMVLARSGAATLSLSTYEPVQASVEPETAAFADCERHELVLSGHARGALHVLDQDGSIATQAMRWRKGDRICCPARRASRHLIAVEQSVVMLQLTRVPSRPLPTLVYGLSGGAPLHQSSGDKRASEQVMALGVLGALGQDRLIEPMIAFAGQGDKDPDARWEAVRQVLALDLRRGMILLGELERRGADPIAGPASRLRRELAARHPGLSQPEGEPA